MIENELTETVIDDVQLTEFPSYQTLAEHKDAEKQVLVKTLMGGSDFPLDFWNATIEYSSQENFNSVLDFLANLPSLQKEFGNEETAENWTWSDIEPTTLENKFTHRPELIRMLRAKGMTDALISEGWLIKSASGQVDGETSWSDTSHLLITDQHYVFIQLYHVITN